MTSEEYITIKKSFSAIGFQSFVICVTLCCSKSNQICNFLKVLSRVRNNDEVVLKKKLQGRGDVKDLEGTIVCEIDQLVARWTQVESQAWSSPLILRSDSILS